MEEAKLLALVLIAIAQLVQAYIMTENHIRAWLQERRYREETEQYKQAMQNAAAAGTKWIIPTPPPQ